jgi:hypothetical protein
MLLIKLNPKNDPKGKGRKAKGFPRGEMTGDDHTALGGRKAREWDRERIKN